MESPNTKILSAMAGSGQGGNGTRSTSSEVSPDEDRLWKWLDELATESERVRREEAKFDEFGQYIDMYHGKHWPATLPSFRPPVVANELRTLILSEASDLTESQLRVYITKDPRHGQRDVMLERAFRAVWARQRVDIKLMQACVWALIVGTGFIEVGWDPDEHHGLGDVVVRDADPRYFLPDPDATDDVSWLYVLKEHVLDIHEIRRLFPVSGMRVTPEDRWSMKEPSAGSPTGISSPVYLGPLTPSDTFIRGIIPGYKKARARVLDCTIRDDSIEETVEEIPSVDGGEPELRATVKAKYPDGRRIVGANGVILYDGENQNAGGDFGVLRLVLEPTVGRFWGTGFVQQTAELQLATDKLLSNVVENSVRLNNGIVVSTTNTGLDWECVLPDQEVRLADGTYVRADALSVGAAIIGYAGGQPYVDTVTAVGDGGRQPCVRVRTEFGRTVRVSGTHPFLTDRGWRRADALNVGDVLTTAVPLGFGDTVDRETAAFLGLLVADGGFTARSAASITKNDPDIVEQLRRGAALHGGDLHRGGRSNYYRLVGLQPFFRQHGLAGTRAATKRVPPAVLRGGRETLAAFLAAYLDCDGHLHTFKNDLTTYTTSERLAADVQELWWRLGVRAAVWPHRRRYQGCPYTTWFVKVTNRQDTLRALDLVEPLLVSKKNVARAAAMRQRILVSWESPGRAHRVEERVAAIELLGSHPTVKITTARTHTFVVNGLVTHNTFAGIPAQIVQINPGSEFKIQYPPPMPPDMIQAPHRLLDLQRRLLGFEGARAGAPSKGNVSAELTETEISQAQSPTRLRARLLHAFVQRLAEMIFARMAHGYAGPRAIPSVEGEQFKPVMWEPLPDPEKYAVYVDPASFTVMSRTMLRRLAVLLFKLRGIDRQALLESIGWPDAEQTAKRLADQERLAALAKIQQKKGSSR